MEIVIKEIFNKEVQEYQKELYSFLKMNLDENYPEINTENMARVFYDNMDKYSLDGSAILLGAFDGKRLVGFHWAHESVFLGKRRMHSYMNAVAPDYRGMRIGSNFFRELEKISVERGIEEIEAFCRAANLKAVNYHLHNGFEIENYRVVKKL